MSGTPRITIVTPSFNQGRFLEATIRSVLDQGYSNLEYIVLDGGSTDDSVEIIRRYENRLAWWQSKPDGGQGPAVIEGWRRATGELISWINSDDLLLEGSLATAASAGSHGDDIITGDTLGVDEAGLIIYYAIQPRGPRWMYRHALLHPGQPGTFYRRTTVERVGYFDRELSCAMEFDLALRMLADGATIRYVPRRMAALRSHSQTKTTVLREEFREENRRVFRRHVGGPLGDHRIREPLVRLQTLLYRLRYLDPRRARDTLLKLTWRVSQHHVSALLDGAPPARER